MLQLTMRHIYFAVVDILIILNYLQSIGFTHIMANNFADLDIVVAGGYYI